MDSKSQSLPRMILQIMRMILRLLRLKILLLISRLGVAYGGLPEIRGRRTKPNE
jgi:hypothetical protein